MTQLMLKLNAKFTEEDRDACAPVVDVMVEVAKTARSSGLLALEDYLSKDEEPFFYAGISMLTDGYDHDDIKQILTAMLVSGGFTGAELLKRLIMAQGLIMVYKGLHPDFIYRYLLAMIGEEYLAFEVIEKATAESLLDKFIDEQWDNPKSFTEEEIKQMPNACELDTILDLNHISKIDLQKVLHDANDIDVRCMLRFCGSSNMGTLLENVSRSRANRFIAAYNSFEPNIGYIEDSAQNLMDIIRRYNDAGEITIGVQDDD
jgi:hypothetical protein